MDIVPLHPTGFGVASDKEGSIFVLDFLSENMRNSSSDIEVVLGSYAITGKMVGNLIKVLTEAKAKVDNNIKNKEEVDSGSK